jgi:hypothetical protein
MIRDPFVRRRVGLVFAVIAVGITVSALVGMALFYMGKSHDHF